jgi:hypothetical protein
MRIHRTALITALVLLCGTAASAQEYEARLRGARADVEVRYESLQTLSAGEAKAEFANLSHREQGDVWTFHLLRVIGDHPELTADQRGVLYEALGLVASGAFEIERNDPSWTARVSEPLSHVRARAELLLPPDLVRVALYGLSRDAAMLGTRSRQLTTNATCNCHQGGTDCSPSVPCLRPPPRCTLAQGCGPMFLDGCNGECQF